MSTEKILKIVATECKPEDEEKFNKWYDEVHIPILFKFQEDFIYHERGVIINAGWGGILTAA